MKQVIGLLIVVLALLLVSPILAQDNGPGDTLPLDLALQEPINGEVVRMSGEGVVNANNNNTVVRLNMSGQNADGEEVRHMAVSSFNQHNTNSVNHWWVGNQHCLIHSHRNKNGIRIQNNC